MTLVYLLDTNILSDLVRRPQGIVAERIEAVGEGSVCTSIVVAAELRFGAAKSGSTRLLQQVSAVLERLPVLSFEPPADKAYAEARVDLERSGTPIGGNDLLIASHAIALDLTVVTANTAEFGRVPNLKTENWI